jgi:hypothetical protein
MLFPITCNLAGSLQTEQFDIYQGSSFSADRNIQRNANFTECLVKSAQSHDNFAIIIVNLRANHHDVARERWVS